MSAGPVDEGKIPNMFEVIVCDPDDKSFEGSALGLLCTAVSRATTLGDDEGIGSALYFIGSNMNRNRILNLTCKSGTSEKFTLAMKRERWVRHIKHRTELTRPMVTQVMERADKLFEWANNTCLTYDMLFDRIQCYKQRPV